MSLILDKKESGGVTGFFCAFLLCTPRLGFLFFTPSSFPSYFISCTPSPISNTKSVNQIIIFWVTIINLLCLNCKFLNCVDQSSAILVLTNNGDHLKSLKARNRGGILDRRHVGVVGGCVGEV